MNNQVTTAGQAHLPDEELAALRQNLREQRHFRLEQLSRMTSPSPQRAGRGLEHGSAAHLEVAVKLAASARMVLTDVVAALRRMDQGGYGVCQRCAAAIGLRRLRIVPQARYCGPCQLKEPDQ